MYPEDELTRRNRDQAASESDPFTLERYIQFSRHLGRARSVLDVGCNTGRGGAALKQLRPDVILDGVELLPERIAKIPSGVYREVVCGPLSSIRSSERVYDAVVLGEVIEHVAYADLDKFVADLLGITRPGGVIALTTPNPHSTLMRVRKGRVLGGAHLSVHCQSSLAELFRFHGAQSTYVRGSGKSSRFLGERFPLTFYGSYLLVARTRL